MALRNWDADYERVLKGTLERGHYDVVIAFSIEMAPYLAVARSYGVKTVFDQFNAEYLIQKRAFLADIGHLTRWHGALYSLVQWLKLRRFEQQAIAHCDLLTVVSPGDADSLRVLDATVHPVVVPNGVDTRYFDRRGIAAHPFQRPTLVFSGTLDYRANVDALRWFVTEVLPLVRRQIPDAVLIAVGRRPHPALQQLQAQGLLSLTGEVADTRPYMVGAHVYVVPMRIGGGVRLKVLEALALGVPLVSTSLGIDGIEGFSPQLCRIADDAASMAQAIVDVLDEPPDTSQARVFVQHMYDWQVIVPIIVKELQKITA
jgi:glycosyltransferase involved in cell wall biosynthesis